MLLVFSKRILWYFVLFVLLFIISPVFLFFKKNSSKRKEKSYSPLSLMVPSVVDVWKLKTFNRIGKISACTLHFQSHIVLLMHYSKRFSCIQVLLAVDLAQLFFLGNIGNKYCWDIGYNTWNQVCYRSWSGESAHLQCTYGDWVIGYC